MGWEKLPPNEHYYTWSTIECQKCAKLESENARLSAIVNAGHSEDCGGTDEANDRCDCGWLQREGAHKYILTLEAENETLRANVDSGLLSLSVKIAENARLTARIQELELLLREIWDSIPSTYDENDPMVQRHAKALNAIEKEASHE